MTIINNQLEIAKKFLRFDSEDDFYFIQIIQRKKDNPDLFKESNVLRSFFMTHENGYNVYTQVREYCDKFNARAYINLDTRSFKKVAFKSLEMTATLLANGEYEALKKVYTSACGTVSGKNKKFIIDVDIEEKDYWLVNNIKLALSKVVKYSNEINHSEEQILSFIKVLPTLNGYHVIAPPFDVGKFNKELMQIEFMNMDMYKNFEVKKNSPTLLYANIK